MKGTDQCRSNQPRAPLPYILYILSMLIFGTGGYVFSHISLAASQAVLFRTLLGGLLLSGDPKTLAVKGIVLGFIASIVVIIIAYFIYRFLDYRRNECR